MDEMKKSLRQQLAESMLDIGLIHNQGGLTMDPNKTLADLLRACAQGNDHEAQESSFALADWLNGKGFLPNVGEALKRARLDDLGQCQDGPNQGSDFPPVRPPSYWK